MATHSETISIGTDATLLYPTAPVTAGNQRATASFKPPSEVFIGGPEVTLTTGRSVTDADEVNWHPGTEDLYAIADTTAVDVNVLFSQVDLGALGGMINITHATPASSTP